MIPLSLYIHIPWCEKKCPYCDFNSHTATSIPQEKYAKSLLSDLRQDIDAFRVLINERPVSSIFIGGGTPSLISEATIDKILSGLTAHIKITSDCEVTIEANPSTAEIAKFKSYRQSGVNRLSIGAQSFDDNKLQALGRVHSSKEVIAAFNAAQKAQFNSINLDLMFGLPQQTPEQAQKDLEQAIKLQPHHISWYQLTIEPNTLFANKPPPLPPDEKIWQIQTAGSEQLKMNDYQHYETSAFCQQDKACKHNINYWTFGDYLGIGAGAHGKLTSADGSTIIRTRKRKMPQSYIEDKGFLADKTEIALTERPVEFMMNALRLTQGVPKAFFERRCGLKAKDIAQMLERAKKQGLLEETRDKWIPTMQGQRFLNNLIEVFI